MALRTMVNRLRGRQKPEPTPDTLKDSRAEAPAQEPEGDEAIVFVPEDSPEPAAERYVHRGELGRGGMGTVDNVLDTVLLREVARKTLDPVLAKHPAYVQGFVEEARLSGQLEHPHVVPVYELGTATAGAEFFTMKRVRGTTLHDLLYDTTKPIGSSERTAEVLEIFMKVCDAVSYAHSRGVIHRDIKPANIMVGAFGEVYLMDWGLAKVARGDAPGLIDLPRPEGSPLTRVKEGTVGTPSDMAPEQARGEADRVDERSDVFALGAVLYHAMTGKVPYDGETTEEVLMLARLCAFTPPEEAADVVVPRSFANVIRKAMAALPADRYPTVAALKHDVRRFLRGGVHLPRQVFPPGSTLIEQGTTGDEAYIIVRGHCAVLRTIGGEQRKIRSLGPGEMFGESGVISNQPRTASVQALDKVAVLVLSRAVIEESFADGSWEGLLVKSLVDRFRNIEERLAAFEHAAGEGQGDRPSFPVP